MNGENIQHPTFNAQHSIFARWNHWALNVECWVLNVLFLLSLFSFASARADSPTNQPCMIIAIGAEGEEEYGKQFLKSAELWTNACAKGGVKCVLVGLAPTNETTDDLTLLKQAVMTEPPNSLAELWLVLIGHGTFDGNEAKFNLRGLDLSATELATWLKPFHRPLIVINGASSSAAFIAKLSAPGRAIVTATRSGYEQNYARFGKFLAETIVDPSADLDKDGETSLLEAFVMASRRTSEFYDAEGRLATEHALLDDNGDGLGTSADFFRGVRPVKKPEGGKSADGLRAHQICLVHSTEEQKLSPEIRAKRDELERAFAKLRDLKASLNEDDYYRRLENLMLELAKLYSSGK